jgi:hypothetical protein
MAMHKARNPSNLPPLDFVGSCNALHRVDIDDPNSVLLISQSAAYSGAFSFNDLGMSPKLDWCLV